jgi:hypothetical protein
MTKPKRKLAGSILSMDNKPPKPTRKTVDVHLFVPRARRLNAVPNIQEDIEKLADEMLDWAYKPGSYDPLEFINSKYFVPSRFYKLAETNEYFCDALEVMRSRVTENLVKIWMADGYKERIVTRLLPFNSPQWKEDLQSRFSAVSGINERLKEKLQAVQVVMESIPNSNIVPERKT